MTVIVGSGDMTFASRDECKVSQSSQPIVCPAAGTLFSLAPGVARYNLSCPSLHVMSLKPSQQQRRGDNRYLLY
jgi:hypothetical protein